MKNLNIQQVVLLCLLVSFVSSISTGIAVVSLMQQESEPVTQTINRVVEKTIEKVVPPENGEQSNLAAIAKNLVSSNDRQKEVVTVVVSQDELTVDAVDKNKDALVRIYRQDRVDRVFVGFGLIVDSKGSVMVDSSILNYQNKYWIEYSNKESYRAKFVDGFTNEVLILLEPEGLGEGKEFFKPSFADSQQLKLGQAVVAIGGSKDMIISSGIVTQLETISGVVSKEDADGDSIPEDQLIRITTNVDPLGMYTGAILLNLKGSVVGIRSFDTSSNQPRFIPSNILKTFLTAHGK